MEQRGQSQTLYELSRVATEEDDIQITEKAHRSHGFFLLQIICFSHADLADSADFFTTNYTDLYHAEPMEQRGQSHASMNYAESWQRKTIVNYTNVTNIYSEILRMIWYSNNTNDINENNNDNENNNENKKLRRTYDGPSVP